MEEPIGYTSFRLVAVPAACLGGGVGAAIGLWVGPRAGGLNLGGIDAHPDPRGL